MRIRPGIHSLARRKSQTLPVVVLTLATSAAFVLASIAAQPPQTPPRPSVTIKIPVEYVSVFATVADKKNHYLTDLKQTDFKVYEDGKPQKILIFRSETDLPLRIALLIDASASITGKLKFEQEAATKFLQSVLRPGKDQALLVTFDANVELVQDFTDDVNLLSHAIEKIRASGGTALYDAIYRTCEEKLLEPKGDYRKVIILITDGEDNASDVQSLTRVIEMAQRAEVVIYPISTNSSGLPDSIPEDSRRLDKILREMADQTGGLGFFPFRASDVPQSFEDIGRELRSQYNLAYVSTNTARDGSFRNIQIAVSDKHLRVKFRRGYFAPTDAK